MTSIPAAVFRLKHTRVVYPAGSTLKEISSQPYFLGFVPCCQPQTALLQSHYESALPERLAREGHHTQNIHSSALWTGYSQSWLIFGPQARHQETLTWICPKLEGARSSHSAVIFQCFCVGWTFIWPGAENRYRLVCYGCVSPSEGLSDWLLLLLPLEVCRRQVLPLPCCPQWSSVAGRSLKASQSLAPERPGGGPDAPSAASPFAQDDAPWLHLAPWRARHTNKDVDILLHKELKQTWSRKKNSDGGKDTKEGQTQNALQKPTSLKLKVSSTYFSYLVTRETLPDYEKAQNDLLDIYLCQTCDIWVQERACMSVLALSRRREDKALSSASPSQSADVLSAHRSHRGPTKNLFHQRAATQMASETDGCSLQKLYNTIQKPSSVRHKTICPIHYIRYGCWNN